MEARDIAFVDILVAAYESRQTVRLPGAAFLPTDEAVAYRMANEVLDKLGRPTAAWKIGATAADSMPGLGAARPIFGRLVGDVIHRSPHRFEFGDLMTPVCECEFAFELSEDLDGAQQHWSADTVAERVSNLYPAIEVGERRLSRDQSVPILALIADNSAAGHLVIGDPVADWRSLDLGGAAVTLFIDGKESGAGHGRDVLGHPLNALAWLANERELLGRPLKAGEIVTTGSCTGVAKILRGETHIADFGAFGRVEAVFA